MTTDEHILANEILRTVQDKFNNQVAKGVAKYGVTVNPNDYSVGGWINHATEEAIDFIVYLQTLEAKLAANEEKLETYDEALRNIVDCTKTIADYDETIESVRYYAKTALSLR